MKEISIRSICKTSTYCRCVGKHRRYRWRTRPLAWYRVVGTDALDSHHRHKLRPLKLHPVVRQEVGRVQLPGNFVNAKRLMESLFLEPQLFDFKVLLAPRTHTIQDANCGGRICVEVEIGLDMQLLQ